MQYVEPFALFESENWTLSEIQRMLDAGLMTPTEAAPAIRVVIRRLLAEAGTSEIWSEAGIAALLEIPAVAAVREPEAEPLWNADFKPVSSIVQLAQGTLDWERLISGQSSIEPYPQQWSNVERLVFYEKTGYVRQMIGKGGKLSVLFQSRPGGGLSFFKDRMRELNDRFAIDRPFVPSRRSVAAKERKAAVAADVEATLMRQFGETQADEFINAYLQMANHSFSPTEMARLPRLIMQNWPNLPVRIDKGQPDFYRRLFDSMPPANKLYLVNSPNQPPDTVPGSLWGLYKSQLQAGRIHQN